MRCWACVTQLWLVMNALLAAPSVLCEAWCWVASWVSYASELLYKARIRGLRSHSSELSFCKGKVVGCFWVVEGVLQVVFQGVCLLGLPLQGVLSCAVPHKD